MSQPIAGRQRWRGNWPLLLLVAGHLFLGGAYGLNLPLFESPDEPGHFLFVRYVAAFGRLPVQTAKFDAPRAHHPPAYYVLGAVLTGRIPGQGTPDSIHMVVNPKFGFRAGDAVDDNKAFYVHNGPEERLPFQGQALAVHIVRLLSLAFSTLAVVFTYGAAQQLRPGQAAFAILAAGLVAFNPMVLYMSGLVNNDTAALASGAGLIYLLTRFLRAGFTLPRWGVVGAAWGLGLLLKASALVLAAPIAVGLAQMAWQTPEWRHPNGRLALWSGLATAVPASLIAGWWFGRNVALYGDPLANAAVLLVNGQVRAAQRFANLPGHLSFVFKGLVGCGPIGPLSLCFPDWMYWVAALVVLIAAAGLVRLVLSTPLVAQRLLTGWSQRHPGPAAADPVAGVAFSLWLIHAVLLAATAAATLAYATDCNNCWQGRFMFPAYVSLAVFLAAGFLAWFPTRWHGAGAGFLVVACLALSAFGLWGQVLPRYGIPRLPWPGEVARASPLEAQIGDVARVLAYRVDSTSTRPGGGVAITVYWQVLARTAQPYTVFVHIYAPETGTIAQRDTYPGLGNYATVAWDPGRTFVDTYRLYLPPDAPSTSHAMILLGLYDEASGERLPVTGKDAGPSENSWVQFGSIRIAP